MLRKRLPETLLIAAAIVFLPSGALADAGIPMLPISYPVVLLYLLPVIAIEASYLRFRLGTRWWPTIKGVSIANAVTLVLGYPLAWFISLLAQLLLMLITFLLAKAGLQRLIGDRIFWLSALVPAWLGPVDRLWPILTAFVVLLIPAFFLSSYVETWMAKKYALFDFRGEIRQAIWRANLLSYIFLAGIGVLTISLGWKHHLLPSF